MSREPRGRSYRGPWTRTVLMASERRQVRHQICLLLRRQIEMSLRVVQLDDIRQRRRHAVVEVRRMEREAAQWCRAILPRRAACREVGAAVRFGQAHDV